MSSFELKKISADGIPHAMEKAERYRLLNDPAQAESICHDVLAVAPDNQDAQRCLILSLTDQLGVGGPANAAGTARAHVAQLGDAYERAYYTGLVHERETRAFLSRRTIVRSAAYDGFRHAMEWYERAEALRPPGNADAVLRLEQLRARDRARAARTGRRRARAAARVARRPRRGPPDAQRTCAAGRA